MFGGSEGAAKDAPTGKGINWVEWDMGTMVRSSCPRSRAAESARKWPSFSENLRLAPRFFVRRTLSLLCGDRWATRLAVTNGEPLNRVDERPAPGGEGGRTRRTPGSLGVGFFVDGAGGAWVGHGGVSLGASQHAGGGGRGMVNSGC